MPPQVQNLTGTTEIHDITLNVSYSKNVRQSLSKNTLAGKKTYFTFTIFPILKQAATNLPSSIRHTKLTRTYFVRKQKQRND